MSPELFVRQKRQCLSGVDLSRKGSVDAPILDLVTFINQQDAYFTTSSCSGRIIMYEESITGGIHKKGCRWLMTCHDKCQITDAIEAAQKSEMDAFFKFEPFVMHIQCRDLDDAKIMHAVAVASGFRNSGITIGKSGKIITAVRSTHSLEVPLSSSGKLLVTNEYLAYVVNLANTKMDENLTRIERLFTNLKEALSKERCKPRTRKEKREQNKLLKIKHGDTVKMASVDTSCVVEDPGKCSADMGASGNYSAESYSQNKMDFSNKEDILEDENVLGSLYI